jgi:uncharacterized protein (TIGR00730 family)
MRTLNKIAVYCGSSGAVDEEYMEAARATGAYLALHDISVVYGGGRVGTMGAVADAALQAGGEVIGVIPERLHDLEVGHTGLTELHVVDTMATRKTMMAELSDAFIALPGGFGTLEEVSEVVSLAVLNYHDKPSVCLNVRGFYDHLFTFLEHATTEGFIRTKQRDALGLANTIPEMVTFLREARVPTISEWLKG